MPTPAPMSSEEVLANYKANQTAFPEIYGGMTVPQYSAYQSAFGGGEPGRWSKGETYSWARPINDKINSLVQSTGLPEYFGQFGKNIASEFGLSQPYQEAGQQVGESTPRGLAEIGAFGAAMKAPGLWKIPAVGAALSLPFLRGKGNTGSTGAGLVDAASLGLLPASASLGKSIVGQGMARLIPTGAADSLMGHAAEGLGAQAGMMANMELAKFAQSKVLDQPYQTPGGPDVFGLGLMALQGFAFPHTYKELVGPTAASRFRSALASKANGIQNPVQVEDVLNQLDPEKQAQVSADMDALIKQKVAQGQQIGDALLDIATKGAASKDIQSSLVTQDITTPTGEQKPSDSTPSTEHSVQLETRPQEPSIPKESLTTTSGIVVEPITKKSFVGPQLSEGVVQVATPESPATEVDRTQTVLGVPLGQEPTVVNVMHNEEPVAQLLTTVKQVEKPVSPMDVILQKLGSRKEKTPTTPEPSSGQEPTSPPSELLPPSSPPSAAAPAAPAAQPRPEINLEQSAKEVIQARPIGPKETFDFISSINKVRETLVRDLSESYTSQEVEQVFGDKGLAPVTDAKLQEVVTFLMSKGIKNPVDLVERALNVTRNDMLLALNKYRIEQIKLREQGDLLVQNIESHQEEVSTRLQKIDSNDFLQKAWFQVIQTVSKSIDPIAAQKQLENRVLMGTSKYPESLLDMLETGKITPESFVKQLNRIARSAVISVKGNLSKKQTTGLEQKGQSADDSMSDLVFTEGTSETKQKMEGDLSYQDQELNKNNDELGHKPSFVGTSESDTSEPKEESAQFNSLVKDLNEGSKGVKEIIAEFAPKNASMDRNLLLVKQYLKFRAGFIDAEEFATTTGRASANNLNIGTEKWLLATIRALGVEYGIEGFTPEGLQIKAKSAFGESQLTKSEQQKLKQLNNLPIKGSNAHRKLGQGPEGTTIQNTQDVVRAGMSQLGYSPERIEAFMPYVAKIVSYYKGVGTQRLFRAHSSLGVILGLATPEGAIIGGSKENPVFAKTPFGLIVLNALERSAKQRGTDFGVAELFMTVSHELSHLDTFAAVGTNHMDLISAAARVRAGNYFETMSLPERATFMGHVLAHVIPKEILFDKNGKINLPYLSRINIGVGDTSEMMADFQAIVTLGMAAPDAKTASKMGEFVKDLNYMEDTSLSDFVMSKFQDLTAVTPLLYKVLESMGPMESGLKADYVLNRVMKNMEQALRTNEEATKNIQDIQKLMSNLTPGEFYSYETAMKSPRISSDPMEASYLLFSGDQSKAKLNLPFESAISALGKGVKDYPIEDLRGEVPGLMSNFMTMFHLGERYKSAQSIVDIGLTYPNVVKDYLAKVYSPIISNRGGLKTDNALSELTKSTAAYDTVQKLAALQNEEGKVRVITPESDEGKLLTKHLTPDQKEAVWNAMGVFTKLYQNAANLLVRGNVQTSYSNLADLIMDKNRTLGWKVAKQAGENIFEGVKLTKVVEALKKDLALTPTPEKAQAYQVTLQRQQLAVEKMQKSISELNLPNPAHTVKLMDQAADFVNLSAKLTQSFAGRTGFFSQQRVGDYQLHFHRIDGAKGFVRDMKAAPSMSEANKILLDLHNDPTVDQTSIRLTSKQDKSNRFSSINDQMTMAFSELETDAYKAALKSLPEEEAKQMAAKYHPGQMVMREVMEHSVKKFLIQRKGTESSNELDYFQTSLHYFDGLANGLAKKYTRDEYQLAIKDPELRANPAVQAKMQEYIQSVLNPPAKENRFTNMAVSTYYIGGNFSSAIMDAAQPLSTGVPFFLREGRGLFSTLQLYKNTGMKLLSVAIKSRGQEFLDFGDKDTNEAFKRAVREGVVHTGLIEDTKMNDELDAIRYQRVGEGNLTPYDLGQMVSNKAFQMSRGLMFAYRATSHATTKLAFMAGYDHAISLGKTSEEAYDMGKRAVRYIIPTGGVAARPMVINKFGKMSGLAGSMYVLQGYSAAMTSAVMNLYHESMPTKLGGRDMTPAEKTASRKAFAFAMGTQIVLAGVMGLPFMGAMVAGLEKLFPDLEINKGIRETLAKWLSSDEESGRFFADTAMYGISPSLPFDISSRMGLTDIFGMNPRTGFDFTQVMGATGSLATNTVKGIQQVSEGRLGDAVTTLAPRFLHGAVDMLAHQGKFYDQKGRLIMDPSKSQQVLYALGFKPTQLAEAQRTADVTYRSDQIASKKQGQEYSMLADKLLSGDASYVRDYLQNKELTEPMFNAKAALHAVVDRAYDRVTPKDALKNAPLANLQGRMDIAKSFIGNKNPRISAMQELQMKNQLAQSVGIFGADTMTPAKLSEAAAIDRLIQMYPMMSMTEARQMIRHHLSTSMTFQ